MCLVKCCPVKYSSYCDEISCEFFENVDFRLDNATSQLDLIPDLSRRVDNSEDEHQNLFYSFVPQTLSELEQIAESIKDIKTAENFTALFKFQEEENYKQLEKRYDKLLRETERTVNSLSEISNRIEKCENLFESIIINLERFENRKERLRQASERLTMDKMTRMEFNNAKQDITFQLDKMGAEISFIEKRIGNFSLEEEIKESYNINNKLTGLSLELENIQKLVKEIRENYNQRETTENKNEKIIYDHKKLKQKGPKNKFFVKNPNKPKKEYGNSLTVAQKLKTKLKTKLYG